MLVHKLKNQKEKKKARGHLNNRNVKKKKGKMMLVKKIKKKKKKKKKCVRALKYQFRKKQNCSNR